MIVNFFPFVLLEVEDSIDQGITTPSPMLSALPDSPTLTGLSESSVMSQSMSSDEIEYVDLEKEDRDLGFSILDYKVSQGRFPFKQNFRKFWSEIEWNGYVQPEGFRKRRSTFRGGPLFSVGTFH